MFIMGIVHPQSALLLQRAAKQSAAAKRKYNSSTINLAGYTRGQIKKRVRESDQFTAAEKAFLAYIADQDLENFVLTVTAAQNALSFGDKRWASVKKKLGEKGILVRQSVPLPSKARHWFLDLDFSPLHIAKYDAPLPEKKESSLYNAHARTMCSFAHINPLKHTPPAPLREAGGNVYGNGEAQPDKSTAPPSQPVQPTPTAHDHHPAPKGGGAVLHAPQRSNAPQGSELMDEKNFKQAKEFFDWLGRNGVPSVRMAGQMRKKKDDKRGAPMGFGKPGKLLAEGAPVQSASAANLAQALITRLAGFNKKRIELVVAAAENPLGLSKSILLDDLDADGVREVKKIWQGPGAILETSTGNHQAILILAEPMNRADRKSITDQLVAALGADDGAKSSVQLHRFPGSVNYKSELAEPFTCRLVEFFIGKGEGVQLIKLVQAARHVCPGTVRPMRKLRWSFPTKSVSDEAFRLAADMLVSGASAEQVETVLGAPEWLRHHDGSDWPKRTREQAELFLAGKLYARNGGAHHA